MGYSKEFIEWTNSDLEYVFEVKEVSAGMLPGDSNNVSCEGTGYIGMFKDFEGNLMLKMKSDLSMHCKREIIIKYLTNIKINLNDYLLKKRNIFISFYF